MKLVADPTDKYYLEFSLAEDEVPFIWKLIFFIKLSF